MKVCKEYDVVDKATWNGKTRYAIKPTGNWTIYTDDGEHLDSTDDAHLDALIAHYENAGYIISKLNHLK